MYKNQVNCETGEIALIPLTDEEIAERELIAAEIASQPIYLPTVHDKLAKAGISLDDLKTALGL